MRNHKAYSNKEAKDLIAAWKDSGLPTYKAFAELYAHTINRSVSSVMVRLSNHFKKKGTHVPRSRVKKVKTNPVQTDINFVAEAPKEEVENKPNLLQITIHGSGINMTAMISSVEMLENKIVCQLKHV